ncbi:MAG: metallophosphoesterase family protein [Bacillota bacterium]
METGRVETARVKTVSPLSRFRYLFVYFSALMGALVFVSVLGHQHFRIEALQVRLNIQPALAGYTVMEIPPLATIRAKTHSTPLQLSVRLDGIDLQLAQKMLEKNQSRTSLINTVTGGLRAAAVLFTLKVLLLSAAGGTFGVFLWRRKPGLCHLQGALAAVLSVGVLLLGTYITYDAGKFKNPEYDGALKVAPWIISLAGETLDKIDTLSNKMGMVADNLHQLFNQIDRLQPFGENREGLVKVLHVSDIHNNPAAMGYVQRIAELFRVDMIIDTGDITDYGTPLESLVLERIAGIKAPYLFIPGNHESPETVKKMKAIPGVKVLDGAAVTVKNLRIMGVADPSSKVNDIEPPSLHMIPRYAGQIEKSLAELAEQPDILALHNHRIARLLAGKAPVILYGHDHKLSVEENNGSIMIDPGSAGAAGLRRLQGDKTPYSVVIQYYAPVDGKMKLLAADTITVKNLDSGFHVERHVF